MSIETGIEASRLKGVTDGSKAAMSGVEGADALVSLAEAVVAGPDDEVAKARARLRSELGDAAFVDAAAVVANFQRMVRIADGTGIELDTPVNALTSDLRAELGIDEFPSAANSRRLGRLATWLGRLTGPLFIRAMRLAGERARAREGASRER